MTEKPRRGITLKPSQWRPGLTLNSVTGETASVTVVDTLNAERPGVDVNLGRLLVNDVERAVKDGSPAAMARVTAAYEAFYGMDRTETSRRVAVVRAVERALEKWPGADAETELLILWFAAPEFRDLPLGKAGDWFQQARVAAVTGKTGGGPTNLSAAGVAGHLSAQCKAFGDIVASVASKKYRDALATVTKRKAT